ncbi:shikimate dehydrogenase [Williamsia sterculiae]|uniref:Shikimate dehydrogenase n=1 Tax=Williamsia sterculiae TaxID=1344003 RepID=A0A1N7EHH9_9NOCA|nr:shikimate dehydrogenase [Williamsia sterculiae]SIR87527.1 shikimate dehydrogenase [Williamsia sterculiae]
MAPDSLPTEPPPASGRKAAVVGSPVGHSRSPDLHRAAYAALGLDDWSYDRIDCDADGFAAMLTALGPEWVGLSVTMPDKMVALATATTATARARIVGSANTLIRTPDGWHADCTDIDGVAGALDELDRSDLTDTSAVIVGAGGTALPALAALGGAGVRSVTVVARDSGRAAPVLQLARQLGVTADVVPFERGERLAGRAASSSVLVSTVPADAAATLAADLAAATAVVDVIYHPWPTTLATAVREAGGTVVGGLVMLLNQAYAQVEHFTGMSAPRDAMAAALGSGR